MQSKSMPRNASGSGSKAQKPVPKPPPTPKGVQNGKRPGKPFPAK